jgi:flagellar biosynthetic protein FliQ
MSPQDTIDLSREAITMAAIVGGPILAAGLLIGLILGVLQAMTQIQDQTVSAVPKIVGMALVALLALPWMSSRMVDFTRESFSRPLVGGVQQSRQPTSPVAFSRPLEESVRVASAPAFPATPRLLRASSSSSSLMQPAMPSMQFRGSSMPQMVLPKSTTRSAGESPFRLPTFRRKDQQNAPQNIGG